MTDMARLESLIVKHAALSKAADAAFADNNAKEAEALIEQMSAVQDELELLCPEGPPPELAMKYLSSDGSA